MGFVLCVLLGVAGVEICFEGEVEVGIWWSVVGEIDGDTVRIFISGIGLFVCGIGFLFMGKCVSNVIFGEIDGDTVRIFISGIGLFVCGIGFLFMGKCVSNVIFGVSMGRYGIRFGFCYDRRFDGSTMRRRMESLVSDEFWEWRDCCCDQFVTFVCRMDVGR